MANTELESFLTWLRDAYALERKLVPELQAHAAQAENYPQIRTRIEQHIAETEQHAESVRQLIEELGGEVSTMKTLTGQVMGFMMGHSTALAGDTMVKNALAEFTMEHTEISSYISLIAAAEHLNLPNAVQVLRRILAQEEAMAEWLQNQIPSVTLNYLRDTQIAAAAK